MKGHKMDGRYRPRLNKKKDYESKIGEYRIRQGLTVNELVKLADTNMGAFGGVQTGMTSPVYLRGKKAGTIKPWVQRLLDVCKCDMADAFPRYACKIDAFSLPDFQVNEIELSGYINSQVNDILMSEYTKKMVTCDFVERRMIDARLWELCKRTLSFREYHVLLERFVENKTLDDVGASLNVSRERVRQIEARALRRLRHSKSGIARLVGWKRPKYVWK